MSNIDSTNNNDSQFSRKKAGIRRMVKHNLKIDMTPMVDLGFLLISFFVITTELSKPTVMQLNMPKDGTGSELGKSNALTILLHKNNNIYYYHGDWKNAIEEGGIIQTNFSGKDGLRKVIMEKQNSLDRNSKMKEGRNGLMMLIKSAEEASYKNVVDVLDEATISTVKKYAVIKISEEEKEWLKKQ